MSKDDGERNLPRQSVTGEHEGAPNDRLLSTLERLLEIEATSVDDALDQATQLVAEALNADKVDVFLLDTAAQTLVARGTSDTPLGHKQHAIGLDRMPLANGGRIVQVYTSGEP